MNTLAYQLSFTSKSSTKFQLKYLQEKELTTEIKLNADIDLKKSGNTLEIVIQGELSLYLQNIVNTDHLQIKFQGIQTTQQSDPTEFVLP